MNAQGIFKRLRLLPAIMVLGGALFVIKAAGVVRDAEAQAAGTPSPAMTAPSAPAMKSTVDGDDVDSSSSEVDVLTSLSKRRAELDSRERELRTQQDLIAAAEKRVDDKIANLKALQSQIQVLLGQRDAAQQREIDALVKTYSQMKPRDAARIFDSLEETVLVAVAGHMKPDVLAAIMGQMQSEAARKLTMKLADRLGLPEQATPAPSALQTAMVQPTAAQTPTAPTPAPVTPATTAAPAPASAAAPATGK